MKKSYLLMAAAATMFAACSETEMVNVVNEAEAQKAIGFETFSGKATRHMNSTALNDFHTNFGVYGWENDDNFMPNYKASYDGSTIWNYVQTGQDLEYWNNDATYQFYAVAPYNENVTCDKAGKVEIPVGANATAATENLQADLSKVLNGSAFSANTDWLTAAKPNYKMTDGTTVQFEFSHMMSKLVVAVKKQGTEAVEITSIKVKGHIYSKATFDGTTWSGTNSVDLSGRVGTLDEVNTPYYAMEYLIVPTDAANLKLDIVYEVNGVEKTATDVAISAISKFEAGTYYTLTANIGLSPIQFSASVTPWDDETISDPVTVQ